MQKRKEVKQMKRTAILSFSFTVLVIGLFFTNVKTAQAYSNSYSLGGTTHYSFDGGNGSSYVVGGTTHYSDSTGWNGTSYSVGGTRRYDYNNTNGSYLTGSSYKTGGVDRYNFSGSNGSYTTGSGYYVGGTYHYNINGNIGSCYRVAGTLHCS